MKISGFDDDSIPVFYYLAKIFGAHEVMKAFGAPSHPEVEKPTNRPVANKRSDSDDDFDLFGEKN